MAAHEYKPARVFTIEQANAIGNAERFAQMFAPRIARIEQNLFDQEEAYQLV